MVLLDTSAGAFWKDYMQAFEEAMSAPKSNHVRWAQRLPSP
jgi:hypothetical protein